MKPLYLILSLFLIAGCSKDFLKPYEDRIVGNWEISDINRFGIGGSSSEVHFTNGTFEFRNDGSLTYTDAAGNISKGTWDIQKRQVNSKTFRTLQITAVDFTTERVTGEFYDEMNFRSTDHFVAKINTPFRSFVTHFKR